MIGKDPACAFFQGKPAEGALGINLDQDANAGLKHQLLVYGVQEYKDQFGEIVQAIQGLRDRKEENMVVMNAQHDEYMDNFKKGNNIVVLPIYTLRDCKKWQQGVSYDLLIVASNEQCYKWMAINGLSQGISKASPDEIKIAAKLANDFIEGLLDLTLHDAIPAVPETPDANNEEKRVCDRIKKKREHMEHIENHIKKNKTLKLPEKKGKY
jgi:hypothetical protein